MVRRMFCKKTDCQIRIYAIFVNQPFRLHISNLENNGKEFHAFTNQWTRGCVAYNSTSTLYQVVVDGIFVQNYTRRGLKKPELKISTDLSGKILLGTYQNWGKWIEVIHKVTNLNIFSTAHSVEVMRQNTKGGKCIEDGDYLAWNDMQWTLHGSAVIETVDVEETCQENNPLVDVYDTKSGPGRIQNMESCMQLCEKLKSRTPSITTIEEWNILKEFFLAYKKPIPWLWAPIDDNKVEGLLYT